MTEKRKDVTPVTAETSLPVPGSTCAHRRTNRESRQGVTAVTPGWETRVVFRAWGDLGNAEPLARLAVWPARASFLLDEPRKCRMRFSQPPMAGSSNPSKEGKSNSLRGRRLFCRGRAGTLAGTSGRRL